MRRLSERRGAHLADFSQMRRHAEDPETGVVDDYAERDSARREVERLARAYQRQHDAEMNPPQGDPRSQSRPAAEPEDGDGLPMARQHAYAGPPRALADEPPHPGLPIGARSVEYRRAAREERLQSRGQRQAVNPGEGETPYWMDGPLFSVGVGEASERLPPEILSLAAQAYYPEGFSVLRGESENDFRAWMGDSDSRLRVTHGALADWFEENGHEDLADAIRSEEPGIVREMLGQLVRSQGIDSDTLRAMSRRLHDDPRANRYAEDGLEQFAGGASRPPNRWSRQPRQQQPKPQPRPQQQAQQQPRAQQQLLPSQSKLKLKGAPQTELSRKPPQQATQLQPLANKPPSGLLETLASAPRPGPAAESTMDDLPWAEPIESPSADDIHGPDPADRGDPLFPPMAIPLTQAEIEEHRRREGQQQPRQQPSAVDAANRDGESWIRGLVSPEAGPASLDDLGDLADWAVEQGIPNLASYLSGPLRRMLTGQRLRPSRAASTARDAADAAARDAGRPFSERPRVGRKPRRYAEDPETGVVDDRPRVRKYASGKSATQREVERLARAYQQQHDAETRPAQGDPRSQRPRQGQPEPDAETPVQNDLPPVQRSQEQPVRPSMQEQLAAARELGGPEADSLMMGLAHGDEGYDELDHNALADLLTDHGLYELADRVRDPNEEMTKEMVNDWLDTQYQGALSRSQKEYTDYTGSPSYGPRPEGGDFQLDMLRRGAMRPPRTPEGSYMPHLTTQTASGSRQARLAKVIDPDVYGREFDFYGMPPQGLDAMLDQVLGSDGRYYQQSLRNWLASGDPSDPPMIALDLADPQQRALAKLLNYYAGTNVVAPLDDSLKYYAEGDSTRREVARLSKAYQREHDAEVNPPQGDPRSQRPRQGQPEPDAEVPVQNDLEWESPEQIRVAAAGRGRSAGAEKARQRRMALATRLRGQVWSRDIEDHQLLARILRGDVDQQEATADSWGMVPGGFDYYHGAMPDATDEEVQAVLQGSDSPGGPYQDVLDDAFPEGQPLPPEMRGLLRAIHQHRGGQLPGETWEQARDRSNRDYNFMLAQLADMLEDRGEPEIAEGLRRGAVNPYNVIDAARRRANKGEDFTERRHQR